MTQYFYVDESGDAGLANKGSVYYYDDGLQIADMIAGAARQMIWDDDPAYFQTFSSKVVDLWRVG